MPRNKKIFSIACLFLLAVACGVFLFHGTVGAASTDTFGVDQVGQSIPLGGGDIRVTIGKIIRAVLGLLGVIALGLVLYAGFTITTAGGDEEKVATGKKILINAVIGLAIIMSAFAIVHFVLRNLSEATGSGSVGANISAACQDIGYAATHRAECNVGVSDFNCDANPAWCQGDKFVVRSLTPRSATLGIDNVVIRAVFSRAVGTDPVGVMRILRDSNDVTSEFDLSFIAEKKVLEAKIKEDKSTCGDKLCLPRGSYVVQILGGNVQDEAGNQLDTAFNAALSADFTVRDGSGVLDGEAPTLNTFNIGGYSGDSISLSRGGNFPIVAGIIDNSGASYVRLTVAREGGASILTDYYGPLNTSNATAQNPYNFSYPLPIAQNVGLQEVYVVTLTVFDVDHQSRTFTKRITIIDSSCSNGVKDGNETEVDAGGTCLNQESCTDNSQCRSGMCDLSRRVCVPRPQIVTVSPSWDGAPGNWVTVQGMYFGAQAGTVEFGYDTNNSQTIDDTDTWVPAKLAGCGSVPSWTDTYIIAEIPATNQQVDEQVLATNPLKNKRAIRVTRHKENSTDPNLRDSTTDDVGPRGGTDNGYFLINTESRPGLCSVVTADGAHAGISNTDVVATGRGFGAGNNQSSITFGGESAEKTGWSDTQIGARVPRNMNPGIVAVEVSVDGKKSNGVPFTILAVGQNLLPDVQTVDPASVTVGSLITLQGQRFGSGGTAYLAPRSGMSCNEGDGCYQLPGPPATCGVTWKDTSIVLRVPPVPLGNYFVVVRTSLGAVSDGQDRISIIDGAPRPSICNIVPSSGPAPRTDAIRIIGFNFAKSSSVYFWKRNADPANLDTWFVTTTVAITDEVIDTFLPVDDHGFSLPTGQSPIKVKSQEAVSNAGVYTVSDCTQDTANVPTGSQCCASGPDKGMLKQVGEACAGETKEAGYVWRFTTGKIAAVPYVLEECDVQGFLNPGAAVSFPSPTPWSQKGNGTNACLNSLVAVKFSVDMDPATLNANTVKLFTCPTTADGKNPDCSKKQQLDAATAPIYSSKLLLVRPPQAAALSPETWYHVELSDQIKSKEVQFVLGRNQIFNQPILKTRPCGAGTAYCFEFKTASISDSNLDRGMCELREASIEPASYTARRLGVVDSPQGSGEPYRYFVWGRGNQLCSALNVDTMGWSWGSKDSTKATATKTPFNGFQSVYATVEALQHTAPNSVKITAETAGELVQSVTQQSQKVFSRTPVSFDLLVESGMKPGLSLKVNQPSDARIVRHNDEINFLDDTKITVKFTLNDTVSSDIYGGINVAGEQSARRIVFSKYPTYEGYVLDIKNTKGPSRKAFVFSYQVGTQVNTLAELIPAQDWNKELQYTIDKKANEISLSRDGRLVQRSSEKFNPDDVRKNVGPVSIGTVGAEALYGTVSQLTLETMRNVTTSEVKDIVTTNRTNVYVASSTLTVDLGSPRVNQSWPRCTEACTDATVGLSFSRQMKQATYESGITLRECTGEECTAFTGSPLSKVVIDKDPLTFRFTADLKPNTWYKVVASPTILSLGQLNPERDGPALVTESWKFKTKEAACSVNSVNVYPDPFTAHIFQEKTKYSAYPYGAPDSCSPVTGQELDPWKYGWSWSSADAKVATVSQFESQGRLRPYCSSVCLPVGSDVVRSASVPATCGDGVVDIKRGEDCDIAVRGETAESCTYSCLRPGNTNHGDGAGQCGNKIVEPAKGEECEVGVGGATADTCTSICLNAGGSTTGFTGDADRSVCGSPSITAGEECEISGKESEGCSKQCLHAGTTISQAWCDAQNSVVAAEAGCSNAVSVCGNHIIESGESCEVGVNGATNINCSDSCLIQKACGTSLEQCTAGVEGCNNDCTLQGSFAGYRAPSLCGDGESGTGEYVGQGSPINSRFSCELPVLPDSARRGGNPVQVVTAVGQGTVNETTHAQSTIINATVLGKQGSGTYALQCGYTEQATPAASDTGDAVYNDCPESHNGVDQGVASNSCCYPRPHRVSEYPADGAGVPGAESPAVMLTSKTQRAQEAYANGYAYAHRYIFEDNQRDITELDEQYGRWFGIVSGALNQNRAITPDDIQKMIQTLETMYSEGEDIFGNFDLASSLPGGVNAETQIRTEFSGLATLFEETIPALESVPGEDILAVKNALASVSNAFEQANYKLVPSDVRESFQNFMNEVLAQQTALEAIGGGIPDRNMLKTSAAKIKSAYEAFAVKMGAYKSARQAPISFTALADSMNKLANVYSSSFADGAICRNTYISAVFNGRIEKESLYDNVIIAAGHPKDFKCQTIGQLDVSELVKASLGTQEFSAKKAGFLARIWQSIKDFFLRIFRPNVFASQFSVKNFPVWCSGGVKALPDVLYNTQDGNVAQTIVSLKLQSLLDANTYYAVVLRGGKNGVRDSSGVGIRSATGGSLVDSWVFRAGSDVCKLANVSVEPSSYLFVKPNTTADFVAKAVSKTGARIVPIPTQYDWTWQWSPSNHSVFNIPVPETATNTDHVVIGVKSVEGETEAVALARVIADADGGKDLGVPFPGKLKLTAKFCERPWPDRDRYPYADNVYNFSMGYCADNGVSGEASDDLPLLRETSVDLVDTQKNIVRENVGTDVLKKFFFVNDKNDDVVGVQIFANPYGSVKDWYEHVRAFTNVARLDTVNVDGYEALTDGTTYYVSALNEVKNSSGQSTIYSNVYALSTNVGAQQSTRKVLDLLRESLHFNTNITDFGYCLAEGANLQSSPANISEVVCADDFSCRDASGTPKSDLSGVCSNARAKFRRDWKRLGDIAATQERIEAYKDEKGSYPILDAGSFIPHYTAAYWSVSWGALSGTVRGLPIDPVNKKTVCGDTSADPQTCWNAVSSTYSCPGYSSVYEYSYDTEKAEYMLHGKLEYFSPGSKLVTDRIDSTHFSVLPWCQPLQEYTPFTSRCGDGVVNPASEQCDPPGQITVSSKGIVTPQIINGKCNFTGNNLSCVVAEDCRYIEPVPNLKLPVQGVAKVCTVFDPDKTLADRAAGAGLYYPLVYKLSGIQEASFVSCQNDLGCQPSAYQNKGDMIILGKLNSSNNQVYYTFADIQKDFRNGEGIRYQCLNFLNQPVVNYSSLNIPTGTVDCKGELGGVPEQCPAGQSGIASCSASCRLSYSMCHTTNVCGNGIVEAPEQCDDGGLNGTFGHCGADCRATAGTCGDRTKQPEEFCEKTEARYSPGFCVNVYAPQCNGDTGAQWTRYAVGTNKNLTSVNVFGANGYIAGSRNANGVFLKTTDAKFWLEKIPSFEDNQYVKRMSFTDATRGWVIGGANGNGEDIIAQVTGSAESWSAPREVDDVLSDIFMISPTEGWIVGRPGGNDGVGKGVVWHMSSRNPSVNSWERIIDGRTDASLQEVNPGYSRSLERVFFVSRSVGWALSKQVLLKTINGGNTWVKQSTGTRETAQLSDMYFFNENEGFVVGYANLASGAVSAILKTVNGGSTWIRQNTDLQYEGKKFRNIEFIDRQNGYIVGDDGLILHSTDGGATWTQELSGVSDSLAQVGFGGNGQVWIVGDNGVILSNVADCQVHTCSVDADCAGAVGSCISENDSVYDLSRDNSCAVDCRAPGGYCGDGITQTGEQCDDGNTNVNDGCSAFCRTETRTTQQQLQVQTNVGSCGDGIVQTPNKQGLQEACDLGSQNGVRCTPGYGRSCNYCASDCRSVLTVDPADYCGNGRIDRIGGTDANPVLEACDASGGNMVSSTPVAGNLLASVQNPQCNAMNQGSVTCNSTCTSVINTCVFCGVSENKGAIPKVAVLNVLTPSSTLPNENWGRQTWKELYYQTNGADATRLAFTNTATNETNYLRSNWRKDDNASEFEAAPVDYRDYMSQQWVFLGTRVRSPDGISFWIWPSDPLHTPGSFFGIETNPLCRNVYKLGFNKNQISDPVSTALQTADLFDYPVNGEGVVVENELVISPAVGPGVFRAVVRYPVDSSNMKLAFGVYNQNFAPTSTLTYEVAKMDPNSYLCLQMNRINNANPYWMPTCAGFNGGAVKFNDIGSLAKVAAQGVTIQPSNNNSTATYAVFVQGLRGPINQYKDVLGSGDIIVDLYMFDSTRSINPQYSIFKPTRSFSFKAASLATTNPRARYWHVFNIVRDANGVFKLDTNLTGQDGEVVTGFREVQCHTQGAGCPEPSATE